MPRYPVSKTAVLEKLRRAAARAVSDNLLINGNMASPPTITVGASTDAALTNVYSMVSGGTYQQAGRVLDIGGVATLFSSNTLLALKSTTVGVGGNIGSTAIQNAVARETTSDAPTVEFRIFPQNTSHVRFAVSENGGKMQYTGDWVALNSSTSSSFVKLAFGSSKQRRIRIELAMKQGNSGSPAAAITQIAIAPSYSIWKPKYDPVRIAWLSDSYMGSIGNLDYTQDGPGVVASHLLGGHGTMIAVGGTGYVDANGLLGSILTRLDDLSAQDFDLIVFCLGTNDSSGASLQTNALSAFQGARTRRPLVPIVVFGSWPKPTTAQSATLTVDADIKAAFDAWADGNSYWIPIAGDAAGNWMAGTTDIDAPGASDISGRYIGSDSIHPVTSGSLYYGQRIADGIREKLELNAA